MDKPIRTNLGAVTAYADAVKHGYTGTREEFGQLIANFGDSAKQVADDASEVRQNKENIEGMEANVENLQAQAAQSAQEAEESKTQAAGYASAAEASRQAAETSEQNINAQVTGFDEHVAEKTASAENDIEAARIAANAAVVAQQEESVQEVKNKTSQYITEKQSEAEQAIANKQSEAVEAVNTAGATQTDAVNTAGAAQKKAVEDAGREALNNIGTGVDSSLSQEGKAADAAATGKAVDELKGDIVHLSDYINFYGIGIRQGGWDLDNNVYTTSKIRTITHPCAFSYCEVKVKVNDGYKFIVYYYDSQGLNGENATPSWQTSDFIIPSNKYYRVLVAKSNDSTIITPYEAFTNCKILTFNRLVNKNELLESSSDAFFNDKFKIKGQFYYGNNLTNGEYEPWVVKRLSLIESISYDKDVAVEITKENYLIFARFYDKAGNYLSVSKEATKLIIPKGSYFRLTIERNDGNVDESPLDLDLVNYVYVSLLNTNVISRNEFAIKNLMASKFHFDTTKTNEWGTDNKNDLFSIAHITDIHTDTRRYKNFVDFINYTDLVDSAICTGDFVIYPSDTEITSMMSIDSDKEILKVVGNHDKSAGGITLTNTEIISKFNMNHGTYYNVEYTSKGIDLIVLNQYDDDTSCYSESQIDWFINELKRCATNNLHVLVAFHAPCTFPSSNDKGFYQRHRRWTNSLVPTMGRSIEDIIEAFRKGTSKTVDFSGFTKTVDFSNNQGIFIAYMCGHYHGDYIGYSSSYTAQLYLMGNCGACIPDGTSQNYGEEVSDLPRHDGTQTEDCFNIYTIDTDNKLVKVVRVGSSINDLMQKREFAIYEY